MSNSLDPDQVQHFVGPDLGPSCLQKLSVDDTSWLEINQFSSFIHTLRKLMKMFTAF